MEEFDRKKKPGQMENRENSCSQVCKEEINILKIGRASCREIVSIYVVIEGGGGGG